MSTTERRIEHPRLIAWRVLMLTLVGLIVVMTFAQTMSGCRDRTKLIRDITEVKADMRAMRTEYVTLNQYVRDSMALDREIRDLKQEAKELKRLARSKFGRE